MNPFFDKIEPYLLGELSALEREAFEKALRSDPELAGAVNRQNEVMLRLDALRLRHKVKAALGDQAAPEQKTALRVVRLAWAVAASLVLLVAALWFLYRPPAENAPDIAVQPPVIARPDTLVRTEAPAPGAVPAPEIARPEARSGPSPATRANLVALARQYSVGPTASRLRGSAGSAQAPESGTPAERAAEAYERQDYRRVNELLQADRLVEQDEEARFLRASARFQTALYSAAAADFKALEGSFQFRHEARWNFILCQLALGNQDAARALLASAAADPDFPFQLKAAELGRKLDRR
jgi:hypothetical protein